MPAKKSTKKAVKKKTTKKKVVKKAAKKKSTKKLQPGQDAKGKFLPGNKFGTRSKRPPGRELVEEMIRSIGDELVEKGASDTSKLEAVIRSAYINALAGKPWAVNLIMDRVAGKVTNKLDVNANQTVEFVNIGKDAVDITKL